MRRIALAIACVLASFVGFCSAVGFLGVVFTGLPDLPHFIFLAAALFGASLFSALASFALGKWCFHRPVRIVPFAISVPLLAGIGFLLFQWFFAGEVLNSAYPALAFLGVVLLTFQGMVFGFQPIKKEPNDRVDGQ